MMVGLQHFMNNIVCNWASTHSPVDVAEVWILTQKIRHQVAKCYADKKVFRTCTDVKVTRSFKYFQAVAADFCVESQALASLD